MLALLLLLLMSPPPKHELRGVWLTTVVNLDWPSKRTLTVEQQKAELVTQLDQIKSLGLNAVYFQVRTEADALFDSPYEPWSFWLTGTQGLAPQPLWDPLAFTIEEAHKRGLELHAWMNPYRASRDTASYTWAETHVARRKPEWMMYFTSSTGTYAMLNPGSPEVRDYIASLIADIVRRYEVDGIHFDDYFYPYNPKITSEDAREFRAYGNSFRNVHEWRRDNVNRMVAQVHDTIKAIDPLVKFGISPFGIRLNSDAGTRGTEGYHSLYADAVAWFRAGKIDYITPQLYWERDHNLAPYKPLLTWWSRTAATYGRHLYVGLAPYRPWPASEIGAQVRLNRASDGAQGAIFFRTKSLTEATNGLQDSLRTRLYPHPALVPVMPWLGSHVPAAVEDIQVMRSNRALITLSWTASPSAARYAVYRYATDRLPADATRPGTPDALLDITGETRFADSAALPGNSYVYVVTAIGRNGEESVARAVFVD
ncbi:MAG: hypothetical protein RL177_1436 [Bacteroidota bacterium]